MSKISLYFVKPHAMEYAEVIHALISGSGFETVDEASAILDEHAMKVLYPDAGPGIMSLCMKHLVGKKVEFGIVYADDAIPRLLALCGEKTNPDECAEGTIRNFFGIERAILVPGEGSFHNNVVHRSKNESELERDLDLFAYLTRRSPNTK